MTIKRHLGDAGFLDNGIYAYRTRALVGEQIVGRSKDPFACVLSPHHPDGFRIAVQRDTPLLAVAQQTVHIPMGTVLAMLFVGFLWCENV